MSRRTFSLETIRSTTIGATRTNSPSILQFVSSNVWNATHRSSRISRTPSGPRPQPRGPLPPPRGSQSRWQQFRQTFDKIPQQAILWGVLILNGAVYGMWHLAIVKYKSTGDQGPFVWMINNFTTSYANMSAGRIWTLLTSCFSHEDTAHLLVNGFSFYFMAPTVQELLGNSRFLAFYLGAGLFASVVSLFWHHDIKKQHPQYSSHGASGAIYGIVSFFACVAPRAPIYLFAILPMPAWLFVSGIFLWDGSSAIFNHRQGTDTAGHVGGILAGIAFYRWLRLR